MRRADGLGFESQPFSRFDLAVQLINFMKLAEYFRRQSRMTIGLLGVGLVLCVGIADYLTGPHIALLFFYLLPVCFAAWFAGRWPGVFVACASGGVSYMAHFLDPSNERSALLLLWNMLMRFGVLVVAAVLTNEVAERKRVEAALRRQTGVLQSILNSMGDGVVVADANAKIVMFNPAAERLLRKGLGNIEPDQWLEKHETYLPNTLTAYPTNEHPLLQAVRGEVIDGAEMVLHDANGQESVWLSTTGRPLIDEDGHSQGGVVVFSDMTSRKLMEKQIAEISDREQCRIGQDLHDGLCQQLVSIAFATELLREKLAAEKREEQAARAEVIAGMVNHAITQARQFARGLYPVRLEEDGLASALQEMSDHVQSFNNIACRFTCDEPVMIHNSIAGSNLFRIAQEAVNNAVKHSRGKHISIGLGAVEDEITLTVKDDGVGFPAVLEKHEGMGLYIMNYRARMIGASLDIRRGAGGGTIVICSFLNENTVEKAHAQPSNKREG
jgi:signal transduction histidine kinase